MKSLRRQLSFSILLTVFITIGLIGLFSNWLINREFENYITNLGQQRRENIVEALNKQYDGFRRKWQQDYVHAIGMNALYDGYIIKVYDVNEHVIWDAQNHDMTLCGKVMDEISARMKERGAVGGFVNHIYDIKQKDKKVGTVSIKYYGPFFMNEADFNFITVMNKVLFTIGILSSGCSVMIGVLMARRISRPITKTAYIAKQISKGNYNIRFEPVTKIKELNDLVTAINYLSDALNEQENLRKQMTADVAHELRTPLTAVGSHLEAMIEGLWEATPKRLKSCHEEVLRLETLVSDLGQLAKLEGEQLLLNVSEVNLLNIVQIVSDTMKGEITKKDLAISITGCEVFVKADKNRLTQVITNLLSNAVKYTEESGKIEIQVTETKENGIVRVKDNGIGIPQKELHFVFERFYRTDKSRNRRSGGSGIGLTIVKSIVAAHGGTVAVESQEGKGSTFIVSIPRG